MNSPFEEYLSSASLAKIYLSQKSKLLALKRSTMDDLFFFEAIIIFIFFFFYSFLISVKNSKGFSKFFQKS